MACERDLTSGIADVGNIPVIGIINDRPNGPCYNTVVDINEFKRGLMILYLINSRLRRFCICT